jgi:uncharacterized protein (DUF2147 family)
MAQFNRIRALVYWFIACLLLGALSARASQTRGEALGYWSTQGGHGVIEITRCGDDLCGRIVGIGRAPDEPVPTDVQGRSQCGLPIISDARPESDGSWLGRITDPRNGRTYQAKFWVDETGRLHLRGFIGTPLLGQTQIWDRFSGQLTGQCGLA